jgi:hypothetical protein
MNERSRRNQSTVVGVVALAIAMAIPAFGQTRQIDRGSATLGMFAFHWQTDLNPPTPPLASSFGTAYDETGPNQVHRMLLDRARRVYFGYSVQIDPQAEPGTFRLTFAPLALTAELRQRLGEDASSWKALSTVRFPSPRTIRSGEVLELSLLSNDTWGQRLTEYVTVQEALRAEGFQPLHRAREFTFAPGTARDFTVNDASLSLREPRIFINGRLDTAMARSFGEETGAVVWLYIPNRGRYLLSLLPNRQSGFRRAGEIRGSSLRFTIGADVFSVSSAGPIAPGTSPYNLYVLHQPKWRPTYPNANLDVATIGAADRVEDALAR